MLNYQRVNRFLQLKLPFWDASAVFGQTDITAALRCTGKRTSDEGARCSGIASSVRGQRWFQGIRKGPAVNTSNMAFVSWEGHNRAKYDKIWTGWKTLRHWRMRERMTMMMRRKKKDDDGDDGNDNDVVGSCVASSLLRLHLDEFLVLHLFLCNCSTLWIAIKRGKYLSLICSRLTRHQALVFWSRIGLTRT